MGQNPPLQYFKELNRQHVITMYTIKIYLIKMFIDVLVGMIYIIKLIIWILLKINLIKFKICRRKNARIFLQERI